jgi:hypothetical protein
VRDAASTGTINGIGCSVERQRTAVPAE